MADGNLQTGVRLAEPSVFDVGWLCQRMRSDEIAQWCALTGHATYDAELAARGVLATMGPFAFSILGDDNMPVVVGGFVETRPRVFQTWMVGTEEGWTSHWRSITKHAKRAMDALLKERAHRVETVALASREAAHAWYVGGLGMKQEATLRRYFSDGQDGVMFSKVRP